jgi:hypothetical protein
MRIAASLAIVAALVLPAGCGGSGAGTTGGAPAGDGDISTHQIRVAWEGEPSCKRPQGASRWGCSVGDYRCQGVVTDRGWSVSCSRPGRSVAFTVRR